MVLMTIGSVDSTVFISTVYGIWYWWSFLVVYLGWAKSSLSIWYRLVDNYFLCIY